MGKRRRGWHEPCYSSPEHDRPDLPIRQLSVVPEAIGRGALRQEAIASNIANAETPGYHRLDLAPSFAEQLKSRMSAGEDVSSDDSLVPTLAEDTHAQSTRPDGNSVEIEHELLAMNKNSVEYDYLTEVVSTNIKQLKMAITGQGS